MEYAVDKKNSIKLGDELIYGEGCLETTFFVTFMKGNTIAGIEKSGYPCFYNLPHGYFKKTGRHIDIENLLS